MVPSLPLLSCESSVSVKENPDRKKKQKNKKKTPSHRSILQTCRLSLSNEEISPFWFTSPLLPVNANNLPVFKNFSEAPRQDLLSQIFCNTPSCFAFCNCWFKNFPLKVASGTKLFFALHVKLMKFFIWRKNNVSFSKFLNFCVFMKYTDFKICDVIISIAMQCKLHLCLFLLNSKSYQNETWSNTSVLYDKYF